MTILGIDYGKSKIGLSVAQNDLAEPYEVLHIKSADEAILKILKVIDLLKAEKVIVGISEGAMAVESKNFALILKSKINLPVELHDETLSTYDAQKMSRESGVQRKKRKEMEDAYAATIMLQDYLAAN